MAEDGAVGEGALDLWWHLAPISLFRNNVVSPSVHTHLGLFSPATALFVSLLWKEDHMVSKVPFPSALALSQHG